MAFARRRYNLDTGKPELRKSDVKTEVLYQKLDGVWYAFTLVDDDIFYGIVPDEMLEKVNNEKFDKKQKRL